MTLIPKCLNLVPPPLRAKYLKLMRDENEATIQASETGSSPSQDGTLQGVAASSVDVGIVSSVLAPPFSAKYTKSDTAEESSDKFSTEGRTPIGHSVTHQRLDSTLLSSQGIISAKQTQDQNFLRSLPPPLRAKHLKTIIIGEILGETVKTFKTGEDSTLNTTMASQSSVFDAQSCSKTDKPLLVPKEQLDLSHLPPPLRERRLLGLMDRDIAADDATKDSPSPVENGVVSERDPSLTSKDEVTPLHLYPDHVLTPQLKEQTDTRISFPRVLPADLTSSSMPSVNLNLHGNKPAMNCNQQNLYTPQSPLFIQNSLPTGVKILKANKNTVIAPPPVKSSADTCIAAKDTLLLDPHTRFLSESSESLYHIKEETVDRSDVASKAVTIADTGHNIITSLEPAFQPAHSRIHQTYPRESIACVTDTNSTSHQNQSDLANASTTVLVNDPPVGASPYPQEQFHAEVISASINHGNTHITSPDISTHSSICTIAADALVTFDSKLSLKDQVSPYSSVLSEPPHPGEVKQKGDVVPDKFDKLITKDKVYEKCRGKPHGKYGGPRKRSAWPTKEEMKAHKEVLERAAELDYKPEPIDYNSPTQLVDWNGDLLPAPVEWAGRPSYQLEDWSDKMVHYIENCAYLAQRMDGTIFSTTTIETSSPEFTADFNGEIAPTEWVLEQVERQSLQSFWRNYCHRSPEPVDSEDFDYVRPFWKRYGVKPFVNHLHNHSVGFELVHRKDNDDQGADDNTVDDNDDRYRLYLDSKFQTSDSGVQKFLQKRDTYGDGKKKCKGPKNCGKSSNEEEKSDRPMVPIYFRPLHIEVDARQILSIYSYYVRETCEVPGQDTPSLGAMTEWLQRIVSAELPTVVAVKGYPPTKDQNFSHIDKVIGFAFARSRADTNGAPLRTVSLSQYVHSEYRELNVGKNMLDQIMIFLKPTYRSMRYVKWMPDETEKYTQIYECERGIEVVTVVIYGSVNDTSRIERLTTWLGRYGLMPRTDLEEVAMKLGHQVFKIEFQANLEKSYDLKGDGD